MIQTPKVFNQRKKSRRHNCRHLKSLLHFGKQQSDSTLITVLLTTLHEWQLPQSRNCLHLHCAFQASVFLSFIPCPHLGVTGARPIGHYKSAPVLWQRSKTVMCQIEINGTRCSCWYRGVAETDLASHSDDWTSSFVQKLTYWQLAWNKEKEHTKKETVWDYNKVLEEKNEWKFGKTPTCQGAKWG